MKKLFALLVISASLIACKGEKGDTGEDGNPDVKSYEMTIFPNEWAQSGSSGSSEYQYVASKQLSQITQQIADNGIVMAYWKIPTSGGNAYFALPYTITSDGWESTLNYAYATGEIAFTFKDSDLLTIPPSNNIVTKVVVINGFKGKLEEIQNLDYNDLMLHFDIE